MTVIELAEQTKTAGVPAHRRTEDEITTYEFDIGVQRVKYLVAYDCLPGLTYQLGEELRRFSSILFVVDAQVRSHAEQVIGALERLVKVVPVSIETSEKSKRPAQVESMLEHAVDHGIDRNSAVVTMGGGVAGNMGGMVAALLFRGLPLVHFPTTPVAAFDSVLSAKQAVNLRQGKNLCGTFHTPFLIACDLKWLNTVPDRQMAVGVAEMAKNVLAVVPAEAERFVAALEERRRSPRSSVCTLLDVGITAKAPFLSLDPHEHREALVFEYGHTVGHAIEFASGGRISHGEGVAWGMLVAAELAVGVCGLSAEDLAQHYALVCALGVDRSRLAEVDAPSIKRALRLDNKRGHLQDAQDGTLAMVLLQALGKPEAFGPKPLIPVAIDRIESTMDAVLG